MESKKSVIRIIINPNDRFEFYPILLLGFLRNTELLQEDGLNDGG